MPNDQSMAMLQFMSWLRISKYVRNWLYAVAVTNQTESMKCVHARLSCLLGEDHRVEVDRMAVEDRMVEGDNQAEVDRWALLRDETFYELFSKKRRMHWRSSAQR